MEVDEIVYTMVYPDKWDYVILTPSHGVLMGWVVAFAFTTLHPARLLVIY